MEQTLEAKSISSGIQNPGIKWDECEILASESNSIKRKALESMYIRRAKDSVVNRNTGSLDDIWNRTIEHCSNRKARVRKK